MLCSDQHPIDLSFPVKNKQLKIISPVNMVNIGANKIVYSSHQEPFHGK